jgi:hypothetical protein
LHTLCDDGAFEKTGGGGVRFSPGAGFVEE